MKSFLKSIVYILISAGLYFLLDRFLILKSAISNITFSYSQPLLVSISVIYGPLIGGFGIALGSFLLQIGQGSYNWILILCLFLDCALIGFLMRKVNVREGLFNRKDIMAFNSYQIGVNLFCWAILYPALSHFFMNVDYGEVLLLGFFQGWGYIISELMTATLILVVYARTRISAINFYRN